MVDFPEPVGPVMRISPHGLLSAFRKRGSSCSPIPSCSSVILNILSSSSRMVTFSPKTVGIVAIRRSIDRSSASNVARPS